MRPDVERFVGHLEDAEEAVGRRAPRGAVPAEDALLLVALQGKERWRILPKEPDGQSRCQGSGSGTDGHPGTLLPLVTSPNPTQPRA